MRLSLALLFGMALSCGTTCALAQLADGSAVEPREWEVGAYVGIARNSPVGTHLGMTPDRDHLFLGVHVTKPILRWKRWSLAYAPEVVPLLLVSNGPKCVTEQSPVIGGSACVTTTGDPGWVRGVAIVPVGVESQIRIARRWRVYGGAAAGVAWFTRPVPDPGARAFNYTIEFGGGLQWQFRRREWLRVGYKFHHLSNAYTAPSNPGVDGNVFLIGFGVALRSLQS